MFTDNYGLPEYFFTSDATLFSGFPEGGCHFNEHTGIRQQEHPIRFQDDPGFSDRYHNFSDAESQCSIDIEQFNRSGNQHGGRNNSRINDRIFGEIDFCRNPACRTTGRLSNGTGDCQRYGPIHQ